MIKWFLRRQVAAFERAWNYDATYIHDLIDADPRATIAFAKATGIGRYRKDIPAAPHYAAGIVAVMTLDCGPCTQLGIDKAQREGVDPAVLRAAVARDYTAMPYEVALAVRFTEKTLAHAPEADDLREEVLRLWGQRGLTSLALAITAAHLYPTMKYALGHGHACRRLTIGGETRPVLRELTQATQAA
jgi:hypothetical protein